MIILRRIAFALFLLSSVHCASTAPTPAETGGLTAAVDAIFSDYAKPGTPGCAVGIARGGKVVLERGYGYADLEHDIPIAPETIFEAGSVSKQFAAAAIVMLAEEGKLSLDDPARKHVPELHETASAITIRQLLNHTSGLRDFGPIIGVAGWPRGTRLFTHADILEVLGRQESLNFEPGTEWTYNTGAYNVLAVIAERVSGTTLPEFTRTRIFEPLGMTRSSWRDDYRRVVKDRATAYVPSKGGGYRTAMDIENIYGNCCMLTTVGDLLRWDGNFRDSRVAGRAALDAMQTPAKLADGRTLDYGLGLFVDLTPGKRVVWHSGATAGYRAFLARRLDDDLSVALLCNRGDAPLGALVDKVTDAALGRSPGAASEATAATGAKPTGLWLDRSRDAVIRIDETDAKLRMRLRATGGGPALVPGSDGRYRAGSNVVWLEDDGLHLLSTHRPERTYARVEPWTPAAAELASFAGTYRSDEADSTWKVALEGDTLVARPRAALSIALEPLYADGFATPDGDLVRFTRDATGRIDGFVVKADYAMVDGGARLERMPFRRTGD